MVFSLPISPSSGFGTGLACAFVLILASACTPSHQAPDAAAPSPGAPAASTSPAAAPASSAVDAQRKGRASVFVVHLMNDFGAFTRYFQAGAAERAKAGEKGHLVTRLDDGRAAVHFFADDVEAVEKTLRSPEMEHYLQRVGAPESSLMWLTRDVFVKAPAALPAGNTFSLYLKLRTEDLPGLERALLDEEPRFTARGVIGYGLHQTTADEKAAIVHFVGTVRDELVALPDRQEFRELLTRTRSQASSKGLVGVDVARSRGE